MKIALYIEEGTEQIVLTPETQTEKTLLDKLEYRVLSVYKGQFYSCMGGWIRQGTSNESTILRLGKPKSEGDPDVCGI